MPAKGSPEWYAERRQPTRPITPMKPIKDAIAEALDKLQRQIDERNQQPLPGPDCHDH